MARSLVLVGVLLLCGCSTFEEDLFALNGVHRLEVRPYSPYPRTAFALKAMRGKAWKECGATFPGVGPPDPRKRQGGRWLFYLPFLFTWETATLPFWMLDTVYYVVTE